MPDTMIERVAKAMFDAIAPDELTYVGTGDPLDATLIDGDVDLLAAARAALAAMREPTEAMKDAGQVCWREWDGEIELSPDNAGRAFTLMIDAALAEEA